MNALRDKSTGTKPRPVNTAKSPGKKNEKVVGSVVNAALETDPDTKASFGNAVRGVDKVAR